MVTVWVAVACSLIFFMVGVFATVTWYFFKFEYPRWRTPGQDDAVNEMEPTHRRRDVA